MIDFLKESTFAVNDVINKSWVILYKNYKNIAGLCLTMFFLLWMSTFLSSFTAKGVNVINVTAVLIFIVIYLGLQLTLFNYILHAIRTEEKREDDSFVGVFMEFLKENWKVILTNVLVPFLFIYIMSIVGVIFNIDNIWTSILSVLLGLLFVIVRLWNQIKPFFFTILEFWPTKQSFGRFLAAFLISLCLFVLVMVAIMLILLPGVYMGISDKTLAPIALALGAFIGFVILVRVSFFPFFILDQDCQTLRSIRLSFAVTRGNFTKLIILMLMIVVCGLIAQYLQAIGKYFLSLSISLIYSLIIVPLSSVAIAVAYRQMMSEYEGDPDPDILDNII